MHKKAASVHEDYGLKTVFYTRGLSNEIQFLMSPEECAGSSERSCERKQKKNLLFLEGFFLSSSEKLTFEEKNVIFLNTF